VYIILGPEEFLRREAIRSMSAAWRRKEGDAGVDEFTGDECDAATVLDDLRTPGLLAARRLVVVRGADGWISSHRAAIERYVESPSDSGVLVMDVRTCPANTRLYKAVAKLGGIRSCESPAPATLPSWAVNRATSEYARTIDMQAARLLVELAGDDLGRIDAELSKLAAYVGARTSITETDIDEAVGSNRMHVVFGVTAAIARRDAGTALTLWGKVIAGDKDAPFKAVGGLAWSVRQLLDAKRLMHRGGSVDDARRRGRFYISADQLEAQLRRLSLKRLETMLTGLLDIDVASKSGGAAVTRAVERFIVHHGGAR
jgi:DNA polymerase-3 subunit delta